MSTLDISQIIVNSKDFLHAEWAYYKQSGIVKSCAVCPLAIGGDDDIPAGCLDSVGSGFKELEQVLYEVIDLSVDKFTPIVPHDEIVSTDGQIFLFPERRLTSEKKLDMSNGEIAAPPTLPDKKSKTPTNPEYIFMSSAEQVSTYMLDHLKRVGEACLLSGSMKVLNYVVSSALLIKSRITNYKQVLKCSTKEFTTLMNRCTEMIEIMTQHLLNYHSDVIRSSVLHDAPSHDWSSDREYEENEGVSLCIHMWSYYMQGIHADLWLYTSHKVAVVMFANILADTLSLLVRRYLENQPSLSRLSQMRGDIIFIFYAVSSFVFSLIPSPRYLFKGDIQNSIVFPILRRMDFLLRIMAIKCSPLDVVAKAFSAGVPDSMYSENSDQTPMKYNSCPEWLSFFNPRMFPPGTNELSSLPDALAVFLTLNNAALKPSPDQGLILRALLMRDCMATKVILRNLKEIDWKIEKGAICNGPLCFGKRCISPLSPHSVYAATLYIINDRFSSPETLDGLMQVSISRNVNLDLLDRKQVWNKQLPPWQHALVHLAIPILVPVVAEVLKSIPHEPPAQPAHPSKFSFRLENHISEWIRKIISGICEVADLIPISLIHVAKELTAAVPPDIKPLGNHVITQLVISAMYSIVNMRSTLDQLSADGSVSDSQWDMMIALGERLCSLHEGNYDEDLSILTQTLLSRLDQSDTAEDESIDEYTNEEVVEEICRQMADEVMSSIQGQHAFSAIWEFLRRNMRWFRWALRAPEMLPSVAEVPKYDKEPQLCWGPATDSSNPLLYYNQILYNKLNMEDMLKFEGNWEFVLEKDLWMPKSMVTNLIKARPEFKAGSVLTLVESESVKALKKVL